ncbi:MAG TPA: hypothetical protein VFN83_04010 [Gemmatimonadales bacterium]|jgi:hypothetical protein|nr:hypothetical protein [Gemmatimonadales bacterium]
MKPRLLYATFLLGVFAVGAVVAQWVVPAADRSAVWTGLVAGLVVQGPLGWWVVRSVGTQRFLMVWGLGLLGRLALLVLAAVVIRPAMGLDAAPLLFTLAAVLTVLLLVEGIVALIEHSRTPVS